MHFRTHVKEENRGKWDMTNTHDGMVEHDMHVGELLKLIDDLGIANDTVVQVFDRQRSALQHLAGCWYDAFPQRKKLELGRCLSSAVLSFAGLDKFPRGNA